MARVNIDILGFSELKWTGMGEFKWPWLEGVGPDLDLANESTSFPRPLSLAQGWACDPSQPTRVFLETSLAEVFSVIRGWDVEVILKTLVVLLATKGG